MGGAVYRPAGLPGFLEEGFVRARRQLGVKQGQGRPRPCCSSPAGRLEGAKASRGPSTLELGGVPHTNPGLGGTGGLLSRLGSSPVPELRPGLPAPKEDPPNIPPVDTRMGVGGAGKRDGWGWGEKMDRKTKLGEGGIVHEETAGERWGDALAHPSTCSCVRSGSHWPPDRHACPRPRLGLATQEADRAGFPAQVRVVRGLTGSATPAGTLGASGLEKALGRFPLLCKGSESGVRRGRDLGWTAAPEGRSGGLAQVPSPWVTYPPQPCSPPRPPDSAQPRTPPGRTSPPLGPRTPKLPRDVSSRT